MRRACRSRRRTARQPLRVVVDSRLQLPPEARILDAPGAVLVVAALAIAGIASRNGVEVDDTRPIATSFPIFESLLESVSGA